MFNALFKLLDGHAPPRKGKPALPEVSEQALRQEFSAARRRNLPLFLNAVIVLFLAYAVLQGLILRETNFTVMSMLAVASALLLMGLQWRARRGWYPLGHPSLSYATAVFLVWLSMYLRLVFTGDPKQSANLAFLLVATGMLLFTRNWFLAFTNLTLVSWLAAALALPTHPDWLYYAVVVFTAAVTGFLAFIMFTRSYRHQATLRLVTEQQRAELARLSAHLSRFNQELEQKVAERTAELEQAYSQLTQLDQTKADFITIASHELRTPLTIVNFNAQVLLDDETLQENDFYRKRVEGIHSGVMRMESVVETMLDVAKIDSQSLGLQRAPVHLPLLLRMAASQFKPALAARQQTLDVAPMPDVPEILGDTEALQKVFHHLLINAIKYTPDHGRITINGRLLPDQDTVEIAITDTGIGIDSEQREIIFEKFYQTGEVMLHSSGQTTFKGGGPGLGLAIVRGIVCAHNGRVWAESPGHDEETCPGSTFFVRLPVG